MPGLTNDRTGNQLTERAKVPSYRFTKSDRLLKRKEFKTVSKDPTQKARSDHFLFLLKPNHLAKTRLGITASKRVGSAVDRNRVKRRLREFFRKNRQLLPQGFDLVVIARKGAADIGMDRFSKEMMIIVEQVHN